MAFTNRLLLIVPGMGTPVQNDALFLKAGTALASGANTTSLAGLTPAIKNGWIRIKIYASSGAGLVTSIVVTLTDGTTTEVIYTETVVAANSGYQSPQQQVRTIPFLSELAVTQVNVITPTTIAGGSIDIEVGATN